MKNKVLAIDFDDVIHKYSLGYLDGSIYDKPIKGAKKYVNMLYDAGFEIIIFTTRENIKDVEEWMDRWEIKFTEVTNKKPNALAYIDNRAIRFTNWLDIVQYFI